MIKFVIFFLFNTYIGPYVPNRVIFKIRPQYREEIKSAVIPGWKGRALTGFLDIDRLPFGNVIKSFGKVKESRRLLYGKFNPMAQDFGLDLIFIIDYEDKVNVPEICDVLKTLPEIEYSEPDYLYPVKLLPNDPLLGDDFYAKEWHPFKIKCPEAWDLSTGSDNIVLGPIDSAVDWDHPDIYDNLWVNPSEDANGNGIADWPADSNGIDDDGNGFVDDVFGWDFVDNDWDPSPESPEENHGTHVFGIMSAVTNNGVGVASIPWHSKGMAFRCGQGGYILTSSAINAMKYAADNFVYVENFSWGSYYYSSSLNDAVQYVFNSDVIMFGAAGNETTNVAIYPARYDHVVGVAATNYYDEKTFWSNYGPGVDVCAPGENIYSTVPGGSFEQWDGTSMASPTAAGVAGLLRAYKPSLSVAEVESLIVWSCDDIYPLNPDTLYGKLGAGRVNAWRALAMVTYSNPYIIDYTVDDYSGNNDGRPEPGERVRLYFKVTNEIHWLDASNLIFTFHTDDAGITMLDSVVQISTLLNGDTVDIASDFIEFDVSGNTRFVNFSIKITASPQPVDTITSLRLIIGYPEIVLIDDDGGDSIENWYKSILDSLGVVYEEWKRIDGLKSFVTHPRSLVIWFTGNDSTEVLNQEDIDSLSAYLSQGGGLFISSQYLAEDTLPAQFITNYLKTQIDSTGFSDLVGAKSYPGDTIFDSVFLKLYGSGGADNLISADKILPLLGADSILYYTDVRGTQNLGIAAVGYKNTYKTLYFAFPFECIDDNVATRTSKYQLMADILEWFGLSLPSVGEYNSGFEKVLVDNHPVVVKDILSMSLPIRKGEEAIATVYDVQGRQVLSKKFTTPQMKLNLEKYGKGLYILRIKYGKGFSTFKFLKID
ncbi:MAG: S8 family serine peptidase [Candidatus Hydrothermae bacterium]|nr:S8 family serine peptidase [Candidatus Hydrothermae bacterium]